MCVVFNSFSIPLDLSFEPIAFKTQQYHIFTVIVDIVFILDIIICFRTTFMDQLGKEIFDSKMIAINYLKGSFIIDFIAGLPLEYFTHKDIAEQSVIDPKFQGLLKLGRLLRINRIIRYLNTKKDYKAGA